MININNSIQMYMRTRILSMEMKNFEFKKIENIYEMFVSII